MDNPRSALRRGRRPLNAEVEDPGNVESLASSQLGSQDLALHILQGDEVDSLGKLGKEDLQGNVSGETSVSGQIDFPIPPALSFRTVR